MSSATERRDRIEKQVIAKRDKARDHKSANIAPKDKERLQRFRSSKEYYEGKLPNLTQYSMSDTSVMSATERMTAQIMKMLFGNADIGSMKGRNAEDDANADTMQQFCNWQIEYPNKGYQKFYWWIKECLYQLYSVVIVTQKREYTEVEEEKIVPAGQEEEFMRQTKENNVEILGATVETNPETGEQFERVQVKYMKLTANYPLIENVPTEELIWTPGANTFAECELVGRRKQVTIDSLVRNIRKKQKDGTYTGMYDKAKVMEIVESGASSSNSDNSNDNIDSTRQGFAGDDSYDLEDPNRKIWITESYVKADINGDHKLEDCIMTVTDEGNTFIRYEENEDGFPFCVISPVFDPFRIVPDVSGIDALGQWQDLLTAIIRLTVQNLALNNNPQLIVQSAAFVDFNQVLDSEQFLETNGIASDVMKPVAQIPLAPYTLQLIEMIKGWGEEASNINRYNQGMDSKSLNKTATGITALINQGGQAMELIMRNIAETGMKDLFMRMVFLNQKYVDQEQVVRLTNKDLQVNKDNLKGDFDYVVNAGMGAGAKETDIANISGVIQEMPTLMQAGLATLKNAYNAYKKKLELIGMRNTDDYVTDPEAAQQQPQPQGAQGQPQAPEKDNISANIKDAPDEIQAQFWAKQGFQSDPSMFAKQKAEQMEQSRVDQEQKALYGAGKEVIAKHLSPESITLGGPLNGQGGPNGIGPASNGSNKGYPTGNQQGPAQNVV